LLLSLGWEAVVVKGMGLETYFDHPSIWANGFDG